MLVGNASCLRVLRWIIDRLLVLLTAGLVGTPHRMDLARLVVAVRRGEEVLLSLMLRVSRRGQCWQASQILLLLRFVFECLCHLWGNFAPILEVDIYLFLLNLVFCGTRREARLEPECLRDLGNPVRLHNLETLMDVLGLVALPIHPRRLLVYHPILLIVAGVLLRWSVLRHSVGVTF